MTLAVVSTPERARELTDRIKASIESLWDLVIEAYQSRAHVALGYASWDEYCTAEFGTSRLRLPREERQEVVGSLRDAGLSLRAIESATGYSSRTIRRELAGGANATPDPGPSADVCPHCGNDLEDGQVCAGCYPPADSEPPDGADDGNSRVIGLDGKRYWPKKKDKLPQEGGDMKTIDFDYRTGDLNALPPKDRTAVFQQRRFLEGLDATLDGMLISIDSMPALVLPVPDDQSRNLSKSISRAISALGRVRRTIQEGSASK